MAVAHVVGGLTLDEGRLFRSHLLECTACRARVGELRAIAHDLADVERDERRERAAQRTETKERGSDPADVPPPSAPRLRWRTTLIVVAALAGLMALSSWNFVLRSQIETARDQLDQQRDAVNVLQNGTRWRIVTPSEDAAADSVIDGQVSTRDGELAVVVDGLADATYALYLLDGDGATVEARQAEAPDGMVFVYLTAASRASEAEDLVIVRSDDLMPDARGAGPTVFAAERPPPAESLPFDAGADLPVESVGAAGR